MESLEARYVALVRETIKNDDYKDFLQVLKDFRGRRICEAEVCLRMKEVLKDHPHLLWGFSTFVRKEFHPDLFSDYCTCALAKDHVIHQDQAYQKTTPCHEDALKFIIKIKNRFGNNGQIYKSFLALLQNYRYSKISVADVFKEVCFLFRGNADLLEEFVHYLPTNKNQP